MKLMFNLDEGPKTFDVTEVSDESMLNEGDKVLAVKPVTWAVKAGIVAGVSNGIIVLKHDPSGIDTCFDNSGRSNEETVLYRINGSTGSPTKKQ